MFKIRLGSLICAGGLILASCFMSQAVNAAEPFSLTSSAFKDNGELAVKNACNFMKNPNCVGQNVSPPFAWSNPPAGTKSYAFVMFDPEGREGLTFIYWVAYGIPASVTSFAEGEVSKLNDKYVGGNNRGFSFFGSRNILGANLTDAGACNIEGNEIGWWV